MPSGADEQRFLYGKIGTMKSYPVRSFVWTAACLAALAAPLSFGAAADRKQAQAQVLDHAEVPCSNCFFGPSYHYYCFATNDKVLIGYQRTPVFNWKDSSKNYLTRVHSNWAEWTAPGDTLPISYDDKHIWVDRPGGKQVRMLQTYSRDVFMNNDRCRIPLKAQAQAH